MDLALSLMVLCAVVLIAGALILWRRKSAPKTVWLMLVLALVMIVNVAIWTLPDTDGVSPLEQTAQPDPLLE
ncbi:hypothetical protein GRI39_07505 [Altererythrobacter indicus]|uniref:Uncharacterized protein n=1 Tax=Altericroceibacterium indicum TaxID=374177 RepID=A0A845A8N3_9SPHN|nr:hypothetical protein [Altericroceibacterium indicum]MXP25887.1 hypothetical protein [Altericroceibacterium indicum]